ncbi:hypothetical protein CC78DRAFT_125650 [Lojkania enalia]|uniref:Xylanolytic transcriptional activator regulatory domain-containing protein n=1 Tax=Lojkania enalia TaxID=147567 RepID=A0A9P4MY98_9PLEO|nr:hypothetical protein CC78DRAFT_125650 [Didymosphaeria enalia]
MGGNAEFIVNSIRSLPESEVYELIQHIRRGPRLDLPALAETWRKSVPLLPANVAGQHSLETDLSMLMGKPALTQMGESRHFGHTSSLGLVAEDENYTRGRIRQPSIDRAPGTWTVVTADIDLVEGLLDLYFRWSHPFYVIFSRECFYKDFRSGREKYCSPLLVNAILAYACHFTDEPLARTEPDNFRTAGDHFFAEARRLLHEDETPSLTTTQALCVMAMREPSAGRDSSGFMYIGRCMRMAVELGLHLNNSAAPPMHLTPSETEVRKVTFWGCFTVDTVWSVCIGRIAQLPRAAITLDKPILDEPTTGGKYERPYDAFRLVPGQVTSRMFLQEFSTLCELVNDNNFMFFAPKERFTSRRLLDCYHKYLNWHRNLPAPLCLPDEASDVPPQPHIIVLHMLYHTIVLHLFRPLLKVDIIRSDVRPRDICIESANKVSELLRLYRKHYDMRACQLVLTHILLSVCIVHLLFSRDSQTSSNNLVEGLQALEALHICHYFGARSFKIVHALAKNWNLPFPEALKNSSLVPKADGAIVSPAPEPFFVQPTPTISQELTNGFAPLPPPRDPIRRESLSMFASEPNPRLSLPSHQKDTITGLRASSSNSNIAYASGSSITPSSTSAPEPADQLFWTPMPGIGAPILPRTYQMSPMDLTNVLGNVDEWDRFGKDGFKMSETWAQEPMSYSGHDQEGHPTYAHGQELSQHSYDGWWSGGSGGVGHSVG